MLSATRFDGCRWVDWLARTIGEPEPEAPKHSGACTTHKSGRKHRNSWTTKTAETVGREVADAEPKVENKEAMWGAMFNVGKVRTALEVQAPAEIL